MAIRRGCVHRTLSRDPGSSRLALPEPRPLVPNGLRLHGGSTKFGSSSPSAGSSSRCDARRASLDPSPALWQAGLRSDATHVHRRPRFRRPSECRRKHYERPGRGWWSEQSGRRTRQWRSPFQPSRTIRNSCRGPRQCRLCSHAPRAVRARRPSESVEGSVTV